MYRTYLGGWAASNREHIDGSWPDGQDAAGCGGHLQVHYIEYQPLSLHLLPCKAELRELASSHDVSVTLRLIIITPAAENDESAGVREPACRSRRVDGPTTHLVPMFRTEPNVSFVVNRRKLYPHDGVLYLPQAANCWPQKPHKDAQYGTQTLFAEEEHM